MLYALCFVPSTDVYDSFQTFYENVFDDDDDEEIDTFLEYFEKNYIGTKTRYLFLFFFAVNYFFTFIKFQFYLL